MSEPPWIRFEGARFRDELTNYKLKNHPFATHPFFRELEQGKIPKPVVQEWTQQFYPWLACVPIAMAERFSQCSWDPKNDRYRRMILDQLVEEAGDPKGKEPGHPELWLRFCEGLGVPRAQVQSAELRPETMVAIDDFLYTNRVNPFYVSAAGSSEPPNCSPLRPSPPGVPDPLRCARREPGVLPAACDGRCGTQRVDRGDRCRLCLDPGSAQADVGPDASWIFHPRPAGRWGLSRDDVRGPRRSTLNNTGRITD
ncbi:coenzyme PQQ synthesis protein C (PQQC) [mine drainage metagenome]|uniref:Coenzyme PQQ synthesis protein C (PQQC) n=1 Tax=mine drainage metagenome TaxID=410659 RepID=T1A0E9_9ZZZZ